MEDNNQGQQPQNQEPSKSSSKTGIIIAVIVVLALLGWYFMSKKGGEVNSTSENAGMMKTETNANAPMSLKDLMAGKAQKCTVSYPVGKDGNSEGSVYVANGKMRGDFTTEVNGKAEVMHMINDGKTQYMWTEGEHSMAMKMSIDAMMQNKPQQGAPQGQPQSIDQNAKYNYNCQSWSGNDSDFMPPTNVNFTDYTEIMGKMQTPPAGGSASGSTGASSGANVKAMQCAACNNLTGEQQTQCKAALSCP